jgi:hypothetical protein
MLGLTVNLSEVDVRIADLDMPAAEQDLVQRRILHDILHACFRQENFTGVYFWGVADNVSWVEDFYASKDRPLFLDSEYNVKESYKGVHEALTEVDRAGHQQCAMADATSTSIRTSSSISQGISSSQELHFPDDDYADLDNNDAVVGDPWGAEWMVPEPELCEGEGAGPGQPNLAGYARPDWELEAEATEVATRKKQKQSSQL